MDFWLWNLLWFLTAHSQECLFFFFIYTFNFLMCIFTHTHFFLCCQLPFLLTSPFKSKWCSNKRTHQVMHGDTHLRSLKFPHRYITAFCIQIQAEGPKMSNMNIQKRALTVEPELTWPRDEGKSLLCLRLELAGGVAEARLSSGGAAGLAACTPGNTPPLPW